MMKNLMMESFTEFRRKRSGEAYLIFQNPPVDGETGPMPDGPTGWRVCYDLIDVSSGGGEVIAVRNGDQTDVAAIGKAVALAIKYGATVIYFRCDGLEADSMRSLMKQVPELSAFTSSEGKVMLGADEVKPT